MEWLWAQDYTLWQRSTLPEGAAPLAHFPSSFLGLHFLGCKIDHKGTFQWSRLRIPETQKDLGTLRSPTDAESCHQPKDWLLRATKGRRRTERLASHRPTARNIQTHDPESHWSSSCSFRNYVSLSRWNSLAHNTCYKRVQTISAGVCGRLLGEDLWLERSPKDTHLDARLILFQSGPIQLIPTPSLSFWKKTKTS